LFCSASLAHRLRPIDEKCREVGHQVIELLVEHTADVLSTEVTTQNTAPSCC
jgi:hypothetical protein